MTGQVHAVGRAEACISPCLLVLQSLTIDVDAAVTVLDRLLPWTETLLNDSHVSVQIASCQVRFSSLRGSCSIAVHLVCCVATRMTMFLALYFMHACLQQGL